MASRVSLNSPAGPHHSLPQWVAAKPWQWTQWFCHIFSQKPSDPLLSCSGHGWEPLTISHSTSLAGSSLGKAQSAKQERVTRRSACERLGLAPEWKKYHQLQRTRPGANHGEHFHETPGCRVPKLLWDPYPLKWKLASFMCLKRQQIIYRQPERGCTHVLQI